jgi:hypothetical protein
MRRHGSRVRSAVLDGVAPAGMKLPLSFVSDGDAALDRLLDDCDHEERCRQLYPDLRKTIADVRGQLARRPVRAAIQDPRTGERETIDVNENVFLSGIFRPLHVETREPSSYGISSAAQGDFNPLLTQNLEFAATSPESLHWHAPVRDLREDVPQITRTWGNSAARSSDALVDDFINACRTWPKARCRPTLRSGSLQRAGAHALGRHRPGDTMRHAEQLARRCKTRTHRAARGTRGEPARLRAAWWNRS